MAVSRRKFRIRVGTLHEEVIISAATAHNALMLVEAQYGKRCIVVGPTPVR